MWQDLSDRRSPVDIGKYERTIYIEPIEDPAPSVEPAPPIAEPLPEREPEPVR
jgi:hypothetical protein